MEIKIALFWAEIKQRKWWGILQMHKISLSQILATFLIFLLVLPYSFLFLFFQPNMFFTLNSLLSVSVWVAAIVYSWNSSSACVLLYLLEGVVIYFHFSSKIKKVSFMYLKSLNQKSQLWSMGTFMCLNLWWRLKLCWFWFELSLGCLESL